MTFRERLAERRWARQNTVEVFRDLKAAGHLANMTREEVEAEVIAQVVQRRQAELVAAGKPRLDWEALAAFLERIVPVILMLIEVFSKF